MSLELAEQVFLRTTDPTVPLFGSHAPAATVLLYRICDNNPAKFEEATRLLDLFIKEAIRSATVNGSPQTTEAKLVLALGYMTGVLDMKGHEPYLLHDALVSRDSGGLFVRPDRLAAAERLLANGYLSSAEVAKTTLVVLTDDNWTKLIADSKAKLAAEGRAEHPGVDLI